MHNKVATILAEMVHDENVPINIHFGHVHKDFNGDTQIDVLIDFDKENENLLNEVLNKSIQAAISIIIDS